MASRTTAEERALARAGIYRLLALAFSYPASDVLTELTKALEVAQVGSDLHDSDTAAAVRRLAAVFQAVHQAELEACYQRVFTLSYSEDCPLYETAFSASHLFQQAQQQADIAGFYRAFGVDARMERPDHLALELEFSYLLTLKEARARADREAEHVRICREAQRAFLRDHLARWAPLIGNRVVVTGTGTWYEAASRLLVAFVASEERFLQLGEIDRFRDEPILIADEPGELSCPLFETAVTSMAGPQAIDKIEVRGTDVETG